MDSFFGIGAPELIFILLLAGIVMGPQRIRQVAFWLGRTTAQLQAVARGFSRQLNAELSAADDSGEIGAALREMQELRRQVADLKREVTSVAAVPLKEGQQMMQETRQTVENSIKPPHLGREAATDADANGRGDALPTPLEVADDPDK